MANKAMWDWMDKQEGRKEGDSTRALDKEKKRQGYKSTPVRTKALEKKKEGTHKHSWDTAPGMDEKICKGCNIHSPKDSQSKHYIA